MVEVTVSIQIDHPPKATFDFIANPENNPTWQGGMKKCKLTSDGPLGVGSTYEQEAEFMGKPIMTTFKITEYKEGRYIKGESVVSTFPITFKRMVEKQDQSTKVTALVTGDPKGLMGLFPFFTKWMIKRSISKDYQQLKALLER